MRRRTSARLPACRQGCAPRPGPLPRSLVPVQIDTLQHCKRTHASLGAPPASRVPAGAAAGAAAGRGAPTARTHDAGCSRARMQAPAPTHATRRPAAGHAPAASRLRCRTRHHCGLAAASGAKGHRQGRRTAGRAGGATAPQLQGTCGRPPVDAVRGADRCHTNSWCCRQGARASWGLEAPSGRQRPTGGRGLLGQGGSHAARCAGPMFPPAIIWRYRAAAAPLLPPLHPHTPTHAHSQ